MQKFAGRKLCGLLRDAGLVSLGLPCLLLGLMVNVASAQPANDNFANAIDLTSYGDTGSTSGSNVGATIQTGEPDAGYFYASVWYKWTASTNESTEFDANGSSFGTNLVFVQVFKSIGSGISSLNYVAESYNGYFDGYLYNITNRFQAVAGQTYYISVAGYEYPDATGSFKLNWSSGPPLVAAPNDNFADATVLTGDWGSTNADNSLATYEPDEPSHAGYPANASIWYQWTAPKDGEVELDTIGSAVDTVLAVYDGTNLATLNQVAANDDLFPINSSDPQYNENDSADYIGEAVGSTSNGQNVTGSAESEIDQTYYGPSGLRFNAKAGTTYYFAVDTKGVGGAISLNWAYQSSGVFGFATEDADLSTGLPLYQTAETESETPDGLNNSSLSVVSTYYQYNAPGLLVTVTRAAGSSGRVTVDYATENGTALPAMPPNDVAGMAGLDYQQVSGTLVFDDFEMSKTILIPILSGGSGGYTNNTVFGVVLSNPQPDPYQSSDVSQPRLNPKFSTAMVKILNDSADPYGPDMAPVVSTNGFLDPPTNSMPNLVTNLVIIQPTNAIFNFEKSNYRVPEDVNDPANPNSWTTVTIWVERFGTNGAAETLNYRVDNFLEDDQDADEGYNALFPLQPGSDYAVPPQAIQNVFRGVTNADFNMTQGTITFPPFGNGNSLQPITFSIPNSAITKFNKDFRVDLYQEKQVGGGTSPELVGMVAQTTVTILFNDQHPPAGSVDELYNADFNGDLALPPSVVPQTYPANNLENPGVSGEVYSLAVLTNDETIIAGDFLSYNGIGQNDIALVNTNGALDGSFNPGGGVNAAINAVAIDGNQYVIGGDFTAFDGDGCNHFARVNADGSLDLPFSTQQGSGANNTVRAVAVQADGKVLIGGDFTMVDGVPRNYLARLDTNGTLDTAFDPGTTLSGPVYALALPQSLVLSLSRTANGSSNEDDQVLNLGNFTSGTLTVNYDMYSAPNDMRIFYGDTNVTAGTGVQIYDTGSTNGTTTFVLPFGPVGGLTTNEITIVMNQGGSTNAITRWRYNASVSEPTSTGILVGGQFNVAGQSYANIARFTTNGVLDTTFNPGTGPDNTVLALGWQLNGHAVAGGSFTHVNGSSYNHIVRLNSDGSIDTTNFFVGNGADNVVHSITLQPLDGTMYVGGAFSSFNGTHRLGFTRLYSNGTVDTTFMDTAYNQFAGLKRIYSYDSPSVFASGVESDGNVLIGGSFNQVGGGQADPKVCNILDDELGLYGLESFADPNLWVEPKSRDGVRNRSGFARLIGGATPGPGNIGMLQTSLSANKSQSSLSVGLVRTNGILGPVSANFSILPDSAQSGVDYIYDSPAPLYWIAWEYRQNPNQTREHSDGLSGINGFLVDPFGISLNNAESVLNNLSKVTVSVIKNPATSGNLNAQFQLANPSCADNFLLGGENIPLGGALGVSTAPYTEVDDTQKPGTFGFSSATFVATNTRALISVLRSNGVAGIISMSYSTTNGTAIAGVDYTGINNQRLTFNQNVTSNGFNVAIINNGYIYTNIQEKTVNLFLSNLGNSPPGATFGISNAVLRLINPNYQGYLTFSATNFTGAMSSGSLAFVVNRVAGSLGSISVQYVTTNGSALNGVDYSGATGTLSWNSGDVSPRIVSIPLIQTQTVGTSKQFSVSLFNPTNSSVGSAPSLLASGVISNATLTISNDNSYGALQFSAPAYTVNENGGYATITVNRTGGAVGTVSVNYATSPGPNAVGGVNYSDTSGVLTFAANQISSSFTVPIKDDGVVDTEPFYFNVSLSNPTNAVLGSLVNAKVNILDVESFNWPPGSPDTGFTSAGMNASVLALALQPNGQIVACGNFTEVGTVPEGNMARLNQDGTLDTTFQPGLSGANGPVLAVAVQTDNHILIGGSFSSVNGVSRHYISRLNTDGTLDSTFNPGLGADNTVNALAETFIGGVRKIYVGGGFGNVSGSSSPGIGRLNNDGSSDTSFTAGSGADGSVYAIAVYSSNSIYAGKVLIGGTFTHFNGIAINRLARLNADGSADTNFNANLGLGFSDAVRAIAIQSDGRVIVGGSFTTFNGMALNHITRLNADGTRDTNFTANTSDSVESVTLQSDNRIVLVGEFTEANNVTRQHITRLMPGGATDPTINFGDGANGDVDAVVIQPADGMLVIGGSFSQYDDQPHANIARIYGGSTTGSGSFEFTSANYQVDETNVYAVITIRRTGGTSGTNTDFSGDTFVNFATSGGTAVTNVNYTPVNLNVDFPAGEVLEQVTVPVFDDYVITPNLTVNLTLSNPTPPAGIGNQPTATLTIVNTDTTTTVSNHTFGVAFLNGTNYVSEASSPGIIFVQRAGNAASGFQVNYATTDGTAHAGVNYTTTTGTLVFAAGETLKTISVPLINTHGVTNVAFGISLSTTNPQVQLEAPSNAVVVIQPANAGLSFTSPATSVSKNGGAAVITVVCSSPGLETTSTNSAPLSVNYFTSDGTGANAAVNGIDYIATSGTLFFTNGLATNTFTVPIINNSQATGNRAFTVSLTNATAPGKITSPSNQVVTIIDNNSGLGFSALAYSILKTGIAAPITVLRTDNLNTNSSVNFTTHDGTAIAGMDYVATNGTLVFTNGQTTKTFMVTVIANTAVQPDKTVLLQLFSPTNGVLVPPSAATLTIYDNTGSLVVPDGSVLTNESFTPANDIIDPGETVWLIFAFRAEAGTNIANFSAILLATNAVTSPSPVGTMNPTSLTVGGPPALQAFKFTASGTNGQQIAATFQLYNGASGIGTATFTYTLGTLTNTYYNTNAIIINDDTTASPYPSTINISGLGGVVVKATVTLTNMNHGSASDIGVLLAAPDQQDTLLIAHAGGPNAISKVTLKFDDASTNSLPDAASGKTITSGTNRPTSYGTAPYFP
jgi:uncharacterized delta-60 repeat protein